VRILVFIKEVQDLRIAPAPRGDGLARIGFPVPVLNPADRSALQSALGLKRTLPETHITLVHLGPLSGERWIREGLALGCDEGVRVWEEGLDEIHVQGKALVFARLARIFNFDLLLTGTRSSDTGNGQLGVLLASHLQIPFIGSVIALEMRVREGSIIATARLAQGFRQTVRITPPLAACVEPRPEPDDYASLPALLDATLREIPCLDLARIGLHRELLERADSRLTYGSPRFPRPRQKFIPPPDSALPGFLRIRKLIEGTVKRRVGKLVCGDEDRVAEELFQTLREDGWLSHLKKE
jgi:electron transfer flavoprotein beta subunit